MTIVAVAMSGDAFAVWLNRMRETGRSRRDADSARALGVAPNTLVTWKGTGVDRRTALACAALLEGIDPFQSDEVLTFDKKWPKAGKERKAIYQASLQPPKPKRRRSKKTEDQQAAA